MTYSHSYASLAAALLSVGYLSAQTPSWNLPTNGYFYDSVSGSIRPILGVLGSAYAGPAVFTALDWASVAPDGRSALVSQQDRLWWIPDLSNSNPAPLSVGGIDLPVECRWSAGSKTAALLSPRSGTIVWLSFAAPAPTLTQRWELPRLRAAGWTLLAADANANSVLLAARVAGESNIWIASPSTPRSEEHTSEL